MIKWIFPHPFLSLHTIAWPAWNLTMQIYWFNTEEVISNTHSRLIIVRTSFWPSYLLCSWNYVQSDLLSATKPHIFQLWRPLLPHSLLRLTTSSTRRRWRWWIRRKRWTYSCPHSFSLWISTRCTNWTLLILGAESWWSYHPWNLSLGAIIKAMR